MDRRQFLRNAAIIAAGVVAADQLELLERLAPRRIFPAWPTVPRIYADGIHDDYAGLQAFLDGKPVEWKGDIVTGPLSIFGQRLNPTRTLVLTNAIVFSPAFPERILTGCTIDGRAIPDGEPCIRCVGWPEPKLDGYFSNV